MNILHSAFGVGLEAQHLTILQVILRAVLIFFASLCIVRVGNKRFFAQRTAFDMILGLILASMLARAINGSESLGPTIAGGFALALLHRSLAWAACKWPAFGGWIKGHSQTLVEEGRVNEKTMRDHHMANDDLLEELRLNGLEQPLGVKLARLERNGEISVIKKQSAS